MGLDGSVDSWDFCSSTGSLICMGGVSECLISNFVVGWLGLREPDTW